MMMMIYIYIYIYDIYDDIYIVNQNNNVRRWFQETVSVIVQFNFNKQTFSCEFYKMFMNPIFAENQMTASGFFIHHFLLIFATH